jgi:hypothetical protein
MPKEIQNLTQAQSRITDLEQTLYYTCEAFEEFITLTAQQGAKYQEFISQVRSKVLGEYHARIHSRSSCS